jgi:hypothetical protein
MTRHATDVWDKGFRIDSMEAACRFVQSVWGEERVPPVRLHSRGPQPRDLSGSPMWSRPFSTYIFASPSDVQTIRTTERGVVDERHFYRYPLYRALTLLARRDHDRWTKGVPRRPFHPSPVVVLQAMADALFQGKNLTLHYRDGTRVPADMAELFAIGAALKLRSVYAEEYVEWTAKSDSQKAADDAA